MRHHQQTSENPSPYSARAVAHAVKRIFRRTLKVKDSLSFNPKPSMAEKSSKAATAIREPKCFLLQCPNEIIIKIVDYLKLKDIFMFIQTSRDLLTILDIPFHNKSPCHTYRNGYSVLEWAAEKGQVALLKKLQTPRRQKAFSIHSKNKALFIATTYGHLSCISLLLTIGAEVSCMVSGVGLFRELATVKETPLHYAVLGRNLAVVKLLLAYGADLKVMASNGETVLQYAVVSGNEACVRLLLEKGADIGSVDDLSIPIRMEKWGVIQLLLEMGVNPSSASPGGPTACWTAMLWCFPIMKLLLEKGADPESAISGMNITLLQEAVLYRKTQAIPLLLSHGANVSIPDNHGFQPLHLAAGAGTRITLPYQDPWWKFVPCRETVQALLEGGAKVSATDNQGRTALDHALHLGDESIIELLLQDQPKLLDKAGNS